MKLERRRFRRVQIPTRVTTQAGRGVPEVHDVTAENISVGGVLLGTAHTLEVSEKVLLVFTLPGTEREVQVSGTVLHVNPGVYMGVRFDNLSAEDKKAIQNFVGIAEPVPHPPE